MANTTPRTADEGWIQFHGDACQNAQLKDAYEQGWNHGHGLACHNVPKLGTAYHTDDMGTVKADRFTIREVHASLCYAAESNSRQYSPFECIASEFNSAGDGGFRICYDHDDRSEESYATREEAEQAAAQQGWEGTEIEAVECAESLWYAFDVGVSDAISADLAGYTDETYGIEPDNT